MTPEQKLKLKQKLKDMTPEQLKTWAKPQTGKGPTFDPKTSLANGAIESATASLKLSITNEQADALLKKAEAQLAAAIKKEGKSWVSANAQKAIADARQGQDYTKKRRAEKATAPKPPPLSENEKQVDRWNAMGHARAFQDYKKMSPADQKKYEHAYRTFIYSGDS